MSGTTTNKEAVGQAGAGGGKGGARLRAKLRLWLVKGERAEGQADADTT